MRALVIFFGMMLFGANTFAQYGYDNNTYDGPDRYFYDDNFDWRWDIRVRISDGIDNGSLTRREADRLYDRLQRIESKEYAYQSDGYLSAMEQDEIWEDVVFLNRLIGIELSDWDRTYYGYSMPGVSFRGYLPWYAGGNYDFYRFDRRGFGSLSLGYRSRNYFPKNNVYYGNRNYGYNWDRTKNYGSHSGWGNSNGNNGGRNRTYGSRDNNSSWGNGTRNNSSTWGNQDRNRNNSGGSNGGWNNSDRNKGGNNTPSNENTNKSGSWSNGGRNKGSDNSGSNTGSWGNTGSNGSTDNTRGNRSGGSWGNNSGNSTPSTAPSRSQRSEAPSQTSRSHDTGRSNQTEIMTPRPSTGNSETRTNRGDGGRANVPDRGKANDSRRGGGREF